MSVKLEDLKLEYNNVCQKYIDIFCKKQEVEFDGWVNNEVGGIGLFNDFYLNFSDVKLDVDNEIEKGLIFKWYDDNGENIEHYINYCSYTKGLRCSDIKDY